jgi:hypothetical protein
LHDEIADQINRDVYDGSGFALPQKIPTARRKLKSFSQRRRKRRNERTLTAKTAANSPF